MYFERKTKPKSILSQIWFPIVGGGVFFTFLSLFGPPTALFAVGILFLTFFLYPALIYFRTRNNGYLALTIFFVSIGLVCITVPAVIADKSNLGILPVLVVVMYGTMITVFVMSINRKMRWRGEDVFELAALTVEDIGDNFTARPRPAGHVPVSKTEMIRFMDFMTRNLIAFAFREDNRVVFVLTLPGNDLPYFLGIKQDYLKDTWVAIDYDGNITVNITEEDYLLFKMDLDFDQICQSLGDLFQEFLELSKKGQDSRIIDRMNSLRLFPLN